MMRRTHNGGSFVARALALMLPVILALMVRADVVERWGAASASVRAIGTLGAKAVYSAPVNVNGGRGTLTVLNLDKAVPDAVRELRRLFPSATFEHGGGSMALARVEAEGRAVRLVLFQPNAFNTTVIMVFDQSAAEAGASRASPALHRLTAVPEYPGSEPLFYAKNDETAVGLQVASTRGSPGDVLEFYRSSLAAAGWKPAPGEKAGGSLQLFAKGTDLCVVLAEAGEEDGTTRITLLHKSLQLK